MLQEGATKEDIERLPRYKFRKIGDVEKQNGEIQGSFGGILTECDTDSPTEHVLPIEDAVSLLELFHILSIHFKISFFLKSVSYKQIVIYISVHVFVTHDYYYYCTSPPNPVGSNLQCIIMIIGDGNISLLFYFFCESLKR